LSSSEPTAEHKDPSHLGRIGVPDGQTISQPCLKETSVGVEPTRKAALPAAALPPGSNVRKLKAKPIYFDLLDTPRRSRFGSRPIGLTCCRRNRSGRLIVAAQLGENLQDAIEVRQTWPEPIDKFIEHVFAFDQMLFAICDFLGQ
jgi:hypothetical protein